MKNTRPMEMEMCPIGWSLEKNELKFYLWYDGIKKWNVIGFKVV